jgi:hypothetical protein
MKSCISPVRAAQRSRTSRRLGPVRSGDSLHFARTEEASEICACVERARKQEIALKRYAEFGSRKSTLLASPGRAQLLKPSPPRGRLR